MSMLTRRLAKNVADRTVERSARKVNRDRRRPERIRMPKLVLWTGLGMFFFGALVVAVSVWGEQDYPIPGIVIGSLFALLLGVPSLFAYKNFWYSVDPEGVSFRLAFSGEKRIRFVDIVSKEVIQREKGPVLRMRDSHGTRFQISAPFFDTLPILARFGFYDKYQRWPSPQELDEFTGGAPGVASTMHHRGAFGQQSQSGSEHPGGRVPSQINPRFPWDAPQGGSAPVGAAQFPQHPEQFGAAPGAPQPMGYDQPSDVDSSYSLDPAFRRPEPPARPEPAEASLQPDPLDDDPTVFGLQAGAAAGQGIAPPAGAGVAGGGAVPPQLTGGFPAPTGYPPLSAPSADYAQTSGYPQPSVLPQAPGYQAPSGYSQTPGHPQPSGAPYAAGPQASGPQPPMAPSGLDGYDADETVFTGRGTGVAPLPAPTPSSAPDPDATVFGVRSYETEGLAQGIPSRPAAPSAPAQAVSAPQAGPREGGAEQGEDPEATVFGMPSYGEFARYPSGPGAPVPYGEVAPEVADGQQGQEGNSQGVGGHFPGGSGVFGGR